MTAPFPPTTPPFKRYYKGLSSIEARFPISGERGHVKLSFPWFDAFRPSKKARGWEGAWREFLRVAALFVVGRRDGWGRLMGLSSPWLIDAARPPQKARG